jgi:biopolymer transport protein ExbD
MNFLSRVSEEEPIIPMAPMIDIIFLLLIFFITTSVFARLENEISITVPTAETATTPKRNLGELIINLRLDGGIVVNQREITLDQLGILLNRIAKQFPDQTDRPRKCYRNFGPLRSHGNLECLICSSAPGTGEYQFSRRITVTPLPDIHMTGSRFL